MELTASHRVCTEDRARLHILSIREDGTALCHRSIGTYPHHRPALFTVNIASGAQVVLSDDRNSVFCSPYVTPSPDGRTLAALAPNDEDVRIAPAPYFYPVTVCGAGVALNGCRFSPDGLLIASIQRNRVVRLWHTKGGAMIKTIPNASSFKSATRFSPNGRTLATGGTPSRPDVRLWAAPDWHQPTATLRGHTGETSGLRFSRDGTILATTCNRMDDRSVRMWSVRAGTLLRTLLFPPDNMSTCRYIAFSPDGLRLLASPRSIRSRLSRSSTHVWCINDPSPAPAQTICLDESRGGACFAPNGSIQTLTTRNGRAIILATFPTGEEETVIGGVSNFCDLVSGAFSLDGTQAVACTTNNDSIIRVFDSSRKRAQARTRHIEEELVARAWHPARVAAWCWDVAEQREFDALQKI